MPPQPPSYVSLPTSRDFLENLFSAPLEPSNARTDLAAPVETPDLRPSAKPIVLTLHALFPSLLLPALDLLDRHLVTKLVLQDGSDRNSQRRKNRRSVYYVKSNAHRDGRSRYSRRGDDVGVTSYEVRTQAWSCTCAAYAFSTFNNVGSPPIYEHEEDIFASSDRAGQSVNEEDEMMLDVPEHRENNDSVEGGDWRIGGSMLGEGELPLCKHLLACVLVERWGVAQAMIEEREVSREEMAEWAVGWGG